MASYYNEFDPYAAQWLRNLIAEKLIPEGDVDERSIVDVQPGNLAGYRQCHFFAGIGGWALAARLAGWGDDRELWTGSCPCQPFSVAGKQLGTADERHLWPHYLRLIGARRPMVVMGEQVAAAVGKDWFDGVRADLHGEGYACRGIVLPACTVDAPHRRDRLWFVADRDGVMDHRVGERLERHTRHDGAARGRSIEDRSAAAAGSGCDVAHADIGGPQERAHDSTTGHGRATPANDRESAWNSAEWILGHDGKARRVEPGVRLLAHGVPARVGRLRAYGNAIVPQVAAEVISAYMDCAP